MQLTAQISGRTNGICGGGGPLIVAIHGGTYSSAYFDVPGFSLMARAATNAIACIAIDRPGYGATAMLEPALMDIPGQARFLTEALGALWADHRADHTGVVLVGHSIGAAIAATIAASQPAWPLLGLAISGVGLVTNPGDHDRWQALPDIPQVEVPAEVKDHVMFGPAGSFDPATPARTHAAGAPAPKAELLSITGPWHDLVRPVLRQIAVPVHYRQAEHDRLWIVDRGEVDRFAAGLTAAPLVDARMMAGAGHCIDFHHRGAAFQLQQLGFALECAAGA